MKLPSKELLSEVLHMKLELGDIDRYYLIKDERHLLRLILTDKTDCWNYDINIYELAHKCKEWALSKGYIIEVGVHPTIKKDRTDRDYFYIITTDRGQQLVPKFVEIIKTEPEAIFKACEWILKDTR